VRAGVDLPFRWQGTGMCSHLPCQQSSRGSRDGGDTISLSAGAPHKGFLSDLARRRPTTERVVVDYDHV